MKKRTGFIDNDLYIFPTIKGNQLQARDMRAIIEKIRR